MLLTANIQSYVPSVTETAKCWRKPDENYRAEEVFPLLEETSRSSTRRHCNARRGRFLLDFEKPATLGHSSDADEKSLLRGVSVSLGITVSANEWWSLTRATPVRVSLAVIVIGVSLQAVRCVFVLFHQCYHFFSIAACKMCAMTTILCPTPLLFLVIGSELFFF